MSRSTLATLLSHAWTRHRVPLLAIAAANALFEFVLTRIAPSPDQIGWMQMLLWTLPPDIRTLMGNEVALSSGGFLALGYVHPFFVVLLGVWCIRVTGAAIAGEVGRGTMDLLASRPVPRWQFAAAGFISVTAGLAVILLAAWAMTSLGLRLRGLDVRSSAFLPVVFIAWLLFAAWGAIGLGIGAMSRDAGQATAWTTAVMAVSFVLDYLARLWTPIGSARPFSLFRYYEPQTILASGLPQLPAIVLGAVLVAALGVAVRVTQSRDL